MLTRAPMSDLAQGRLRGHSARSCIPVPGEEERSRPTMAGEVARRVCDEVS